MGRIHVRPLLKAVLLAVCLAGFSYQAATFLILFYSYPVDSKVIINFPHSLELPAISICNFNSYRRTEFCKMFRDQCEVWNRNSTVCEAWPYYCWDRSKPLLVPKVNASSLNTYNRSMHFKLAHTYHGLVRSCKIIISESDARRCESLSPPLAFQSMTDWHDTTTCYTVNFFWLKEKKEELIIPSKAEVEVQLYCEQSEFFPDSWYPGFQVAVHPGKTIVSPFATGSTFLAGRTYYVDVRMTETYLLEPPYQTKCKDYTLGWNEKDGAKPANKKDCENKCLLTQSLELHGCVIESLQYPHDDVVCSNEKEMPETIIKECVKKCPFPCYSKSYSLSIDEYPEHERSPRCVEGKESKEWCYHTTLVFSFSEFFVTSYTLKPKFTYNQIFSNIGGYLGIWLGVSLLSVFDVLLPFLRYMKAKISKENKSAVSIAQIAPAKT